MPNWASVDYAITGEKKVVRRLYKTIEQLSKRKRPLVKNGWTNKNLWLGCLVKKIGGDPEKIYCRGEILDFNFDGETLFLFQECAWGEMDEVRHLIEEKFPELDVYYRVEEGGNDIYIHNDSSGKYFPEKYVLDTSIDIEYFETIEDVAKYATNLVGKKLDPTAEAISEVLETYLEDRDEEFYGLHQFEVVDY